MVRLGWKTGLIGCLVVTAAVAVIPTDQALAAEETGRAAWLMGRTQLADLALTGQRFEQSEIGGSGGEAVEVPGLEQRGGGMSGAWPVLMSLILPGAGEVAIGYKRGYFMAAADIFAWTQVAKYDNEGGDLRDDYIAFADAHYSDELLVDGYSTSHTTVAGEYRDGEGDIYFNISDPIEDVSDLHNLSLYVSKEDDFREYYENLGKWDQFIFGWDDYRSPLQETDLTYTGFRDPDLLQPGVSVHRGEYRIMREESNDAYKKRDRWLYANIGLRVFSVLQVAYLQGLLGGGPAGELEVSGHKIEFEATPMGLYRGTLAAKVSF